MNPDLTTLDAAARIWLCALGRAAWEGGIALGVAWGLCRLLPRLPGTLQCWLWRLAYLRLLTSLLLPAPLALPLLPAETSLRSGSGLWALGSGLARHHAPRARIDSSRSDTINPEPRAQSPEPPYRSGAASCLLLLWLLGAGWRAHRLVADARYTRRLRSRAERVREAGLLAEFRALTGRLRLRRAPLLLASEELCCPLLTGAARPAVLLPATAWDRFSRTELCLMLAHELTHLKRRDLLWAWLPNLGRVFFFFHPVVWLAEGEWRLTHEMACDEQAVAATAAAPTHYAAMLLVALAQLRREGSESFLRAGVVESYGTIRRRLTALRLSRPMPPSRRVFSGAVIAAIGVAGALPWRLTARMEPQPAPGPATARSVPQQALASPVVPGAWDRLRISERLPDRPAPDRRPPRDGATRASVGRTGRATPPVARALPPAVAPDSVSRVASHLATTGRRSPYQKNEPTIPAASPEGTSGSASTAQGGAETFSAEPHSKPTYLMTSAKPDLSALDEEKLRSWKKQAALEEMKLLDWKKEEASSLLYMPKPIMLLSDKEEAQFGSFLSSEDHLKRLAYRKSQLGRIRKQRFPPGDEAAAIARKLAGGRSHIVVMDGVAKGSSPELGGKAVSGAAVSIGPAESKPSDPIPNEDKEGDIR